MNRFMRHFGMTRNEVVTYFSGLKRSTVKESGPYLVYNTPETGEIRARVLYFEKGTPVWVDSDGNYILKVSCGNPMVRGSADQKADTGEVVALNAVRNLRDIEAGDPETAGYTGLSTTVAPPAIPELEAIAIDSAPPATPSRLEPLPIIGGLIVPFTAGLMLNGGSSETDPRAGKHGCARSWMRCACASPKKEKGY